MAIGFSTTPPTTCPWRSPLLFMPLQGVPDWVRILTSTAAPVLMQGNDEATFSYTVAIPGNPDAPMAANLPSSAAFEWRFHGLADEVAFWTAQQSPTPGE
jgi:hypothetical protein